MFSIDPLRVNCSVLDYYPFIQYVYNLRVLILLVLFLICRDINKFREYPLLTPILSSWLFLIDIKLIPFMFLIVPIETIVNAQTLPPHLKWISNGSIRFLSGHLLLLFFLNGLLLQSTKHGLAGGTRHLLSEKLVDIVLKDGLLLLPTLFKLLEGFH